MGDNISTSELPELPPTPTRAPLDDVRSHGQMQSEPSLLEKYAMMKEEIKTLRQANADLNSYLASKTLQWTKSKSDLQESLERLNNALDVEQKLISKINQLTEERDSSKRSCLLAMTALQDLKDSIMATPVLVETRRDRNGDGVIPMAPINSAIPESDGQSISSDNQPLSANSPAASTSTRELENSNEETKKDVSSVPIAVAEHKMPVQKKAYNFRGKLKKEFDDSERTNYLIVMTSMEEEIKSLLKANNKLKSVHGSELRRIRDQLRWYKEEYDRLESRANFAVNSWKQSYEFCSKDLWETMKKLNGSFERELHLKEELKTVTEQRDKERWDYIFSMVNLQDYSNSTAWVTNAAKIEQNVVIPIDEIINPIPAKYLEENTLSDNREELLPTNSPSNSEAQNLSELITNFVKLNQQDQGDEKPVQEDCLMDMDDWELINLCGKVENNIREELPVAVAPIPERKIEAQDEIERIDGNHKTGSLEEGMKNPQTPILSTTSGPGTSDSNNVHEHTETELKQLLPDHKSSTNIKRTELAITLNFAEKFGDETDFEETTT